MICYDQCCVTMKDHAWGKQKQYLQTKMFLGLNIGLPECYLYFNTQTVSKPTQVCNLSQPCMECKAGFHWNLDNFLKSVYTWWLQDKWQKPEQIKVLLLAKRSVIAGYSLVKRYTKWGVPFEIHHETRRISGCLTQSLYSHFIQKCFRVIG